MKDFLAFISIVGFIIVSVLVFIAAKYGGDWATRMMDTVVPMVIQAWILNFAIIINYHYGSSANKENKENK